MKAKNQRGITLADVALSIFIIAVFVTINISLSYNAFTKAQVALRHEKATYYATKIAEHIQGLNYDAVNSYVNLADLDISPGYSCTVEVENPTYENISEPQDLIKVVNITVTYNIRNDTNHFDLRMLKIKE